jgi:hypothetical protein
MDMIPSVNQFKHVQMMITGKKYGNYMSLKKGARDCTKGITQFLFCMPFS